MIENEEFNLSEKIFSPNNQSKTFIELYNLEIILKEFIRLVKDEIENCQMNYANLEELEKAECIKIIDKLAGNKLI